MTIAELIALLQQWPSDRQIVVDCGDAKADEYETRDPSPRVAYRQGPVEL